MKKILLLSLVTSSLLVASGYKIPENSTNAVALGAANVAHNHESADAAFYNPAKMVFMSDTNHIDANLMYIGLDKVQFQGTAGSESSESEDFIIPTLHYVSPALGDNGVRVGLSIVSPAGLSKRWKGTQGIKSAEEFTLKVLEINPTVAFKINDRLSFATGFRVIYSQGIAKAIPVTGVVSQDMKGNSIDFGYNLALAYKPTKAMELGITYRSKVDLNLEGDADLQYPLLRTGNYAVNVTIPLPASLDVALAYTLASKTTLELVYERTYWSSYKALDFNYQNATAEAIFGASRAKNWKDTSTYRVGVTQELQDVTLMAGYVYDNTPVPNGTIGFELPDTDSQAFSLGGRYRVNESTDIGLSALYSVHKSRTVNNSSLNGEFSDGNILVVSLGLGYKF